METFNNLLQFCMWHDSSVFHMVREVLNKLYGFEFRMKL